MDEPIITKNYIELTNAHDRVIIYRKYIKTIRENNQKSCSILVDGYEDTFAINMSLAVLKYKMEQADEIED